MKKFTTECFIRKDTPELRKKLEELGYTFDDESEKDLPWLYTDRCMDGYYGTMEEDDLNLGMSWGIDCGDSEDLFLSLAALREDSDYRQWFTDGEGNWRFSYYHGWAMSECIANDYDVPEWLDQDKWHKATPEELYNKYGVHD